MTGHTGFKGSWLSLWLDALGADVTGYALAPPTEPSLFVAADAGTRMTSIEGDVRDFERLRDALSEALPEVVFHLAAQSVVRQSYRNPLETYATNVMGTVNLLEAVRACGIDATVIVVTSDKCYRNNEWPHGYREDDMLGGRDPYSSSKACAELVAQAYRDSYFGAQPADGPAGTAAGATVARAVPRVATARAGNVIGGGDWTPEQLVPDAIHAFRDRRPVRLRNPLAIRPWQHVLDCLAGYMQLAERLHADGAAFGGAWNFGPPIDEAVTVGDLVERMARTWGEGATWTADPGPHPHETGVLKLDASKAREQLSWWPRLPLDDALGWTVEWYRRWFAGEPARAVCLDQIARYAAMPYRFTPATEQHTIAHA